MQSRDCRSRYGFTAVAGMLVSLANVAVAGPAPERAAMAAFLFRLPAFIEWPDTAFSSPADPFRLCIVGEDPFGAALEAPHDAEAVSGRSIAVQHENAVSPDDHCQEMYVTGEPDFVAQSLAAVSGRPVLTVTDAQGGGKGIVNFVVVQEHVHLEIDQQAAHRNHLSVSSKLLDLAAPPEGSAP